TDRRGQLFLRPAGRRIACAQAFGLTSQHANIAGSPNFPTIPTHKIMDQSMELVGLGMYFEYLPVGRKFKSLSRTINDADICAFINVIHMTEALFTDMDFIRNQSDIKGRL